MTSFHHLLNFIDPIYGKPCITQDIVVLCNEVGFENGDVLPVLCSARLLASERSLLTLTSMLPSF